MPRTLVVIVYSPSQAQVRHIVIPHDDSDVPMHATNLIRGEAVMVGLLTDYRRIGAEAMLARYLNRKPACDTTAVIDFTGRVVATQRLDSKIDRSRYGRLHSDPQGKAVVGQLAGQLGLLP